MMIKDFANISILKKIVLLFASYFIAAQVFSQKTTDRQFWLQYLDSVARPVMSNLAADKLKQTMPVALSPKIDNPANRKSVSYLEAFGRTLSGIAPWLDSEGGSTGEIALRNQYRSWALKAIANAVNPKANDYLQWEGGQPLVDASFFAFGLVRAPWLWQHLDTAVQRQVVNALLLTRSTVPVYSNWILFSGMIEAFFCKYNLPYDAVRLEFAVREFANHWYVGDGLFSDGMDFHMDYYNSFVIQPYLSAIVNIINEKNNRYKWFEPKLEQITQRYAVLLERDINSDGSFPVMGRSIAYRSGVFQHLADMALKKDLPRSLPPAQVRSALTAVIRKTIGAPDTFNEKGWLTIGLHGEQPSLGEFYITTGSLYLCSAIFLPLGLPPEDDFWSKPAMPWTSVKIWNGEDVPADHAEDIH